MTTSFNNALKQGHSVLYALQIEGIPYIFVEKSLSKITAEASATAANYTTVEGLIVDESSNLGIEIDRETGIARGQAATFTLAFQALSDAGVLDDIFTRPTNAQLTRIRNDVTQVATTIDIAGATGFGSPSGYGYIGKEYFTYSGVTTSSGSTIAFTGVTRGQVGNKYVHHANSVSTYGTVSTKPIIWRGRYVTLWEHLVTPDGRLLSSSWMDTDDWGREVWKGYIEEAAMPGVAGMEFTCLPLIRKLSQKLGLEIEWEQDRSIQSGHHYTNSAGYDQPTYRISDEFELLITFDNEGASFEEEAPVYKSGTVLGDSVSVASYLSNSIHDNIAEIESYGVGASSALGGEIPDVHSINPTLNLTAATGTITNLSISKNMARDPYFFANTTFGYTAGTIVTLPFLNTWKSETVLPWLIMKQKEGSSSQDYAVPESGIGVIEADGIEEIITWDQGGVTDPTGFVEIHINHRAYGGVLCDPYLPTKLKTACGHIGQLNESMKTVLTSSGGAGHFGTQDTLSVGFGLAIPEGYINTAAIDNMDTAERQSKCLDVGSTTFEDLYGGWIVLSGSCMVQRRQSDGTVKIEPVLVTVSDFSSLAVDVIITENDVILDRIENLSLISSPNQVVVNTESLVSKASPKVLVRDVPKIQVEGTFEWDLNAPGMAGEEAISRAQQLILLSESYYSLRMPIAPWVDIHPGNSVILDIDSHPLLYNYETGERGAENVPARCIGVEKDLVGHIQYCTFLLSGTLLPNLLFCPTAEVQSKASNTVTLNADEAKWFQIGETAYLYNEGEEDSGESESLVVLLVGTLSLTFTTTPSSWVASGTRITYGKYGAASSDQAKFLYHADNKKLF